MRGIRARVVYHQMCLYQEPTVCVCMGGGGILRGHHKCLPHSLSSFRVAPTTCIPPMWHIAAPFFQGFTASTALHLFIRTGFLLDGESQGCNALDEGTTHLKVDNIRSLTLHERVSMIRFKWLGDICLEPIIGCYER